MQEVGRTRIKSFRLQNNIITGLEKASKRAGKTQSEFIADLLADRIVCDPLLPTFQNILLGADVFQSILNSTNIDALETAASEVAQRNIPLVIELYESNDRPLAFEEFVNGLLANHAHWFHIEGNSDLARGCVMLHHKYGRKWSIFLRASRENRVREEIARSLCYDSSSFRCALY